MEYAESGSKATLYLHGLRHAFSQAHLPIQYSDEAGQRDLRLCKTFATLTTTCPADSIRETLTHELYIKFQVRKSMESQVHLWKLVRRALMFEWCVQRSGVSLWSAFCGHYWHCHSLESFATRGPNRC